MSRGQNILLGVCGGIAAYKSPGLVRGLQHRGYTVRCALTRSALSFVTPLTLEVLTQHPVYQQEYLSATGRGEETHIVAAQWADLMLFVPATAHMIARLAVGLADDFLTTTALGFRGPMILAPAMHSAMWGSETVQEHVATLQRRGADIIGPVVGPLASGEWGVGRMADIEELLASVERRLSHGDLAGRRVLISAGPTWEAIDPVRFLGNRSSGKMGFALAAEAARRGARTTLVAGPVTLPTPPGVDRLNVESAVEMRELIYREAPACDLVVMTAAVADFRPDTVRDHKIKKSKGVPHLQLVENPDILSGLSEHAPGVMLVGFAAETETSEAEARAKLKRKNVEFLIWNDVSNPEIGFASDLNAVTVYRPTGKPVSLPKQSKRELAVGLFDLFSKALDERSASPSGAA